MFAGGEGAEGHLPGHPGRPGQTPHPFQVSLPAAVFSVQCVVCDVQSAVGSL